jgi:hypothetical protein
MNHTSTATLCWFTCCLALLTTACQNNPPIPAADAPTTKKPSVATIVRKAPTITDELRPLIGVWTVMQFEATHVFNNANLPDETRQRLLKEMNNSIGHIFYQFDANGGYAIANESTQISEGRWNVNESSSVLILDPNPLPDGTVNESEVLRILQLTKDKLRIANDEQLVLSLVKKTNPS